MPTAYPSPSCLSGSSAMLQTYQVSIIPAYDYLFPFLHPATALDTLMFQNPQVRIVAVKDLGMGTCLC